MVCSLLANVAVAVPMFLMISTARPLLVFLGIALAMISGSGYHAVLAGFLARAFPSRVRCTGISLSDGLLSALGPARSQLAYRMWSFLEAGVVLPGSSDAPVVRRLTMSAMPRSGSEATTPRAPRTRRSRHGRRCTRTRVGSAHAVHEEHIKGTLARGMLADFTVLSDDLLGVAPDRIADLTVGATVVGGRVAYDAGALKVVA
ncbi:amidohydrolase family protein [Streptomyces sp. NPDC056165]|uniref:amidohydrolase family protein n=1 Tax=Streptomyces sp. NPDC056165 TaxID=3345733 RepID=UPI0035E0DEC3